MNLIDGKNRVNRRPGSHLFPPLVMIGQTAA
jgi:hypothetical protein